MHALPSPTAADLLARARIALDCRLLAWPGVGRYLRELAGALLRVAPDLQFYWLCSEAGAHELPCGPRARAIVLRSRPLSVAEQLAVPWRLRALGIDLLHAPISHSIPLLAPRIVVTLHDLLLHHFPELLPNPLGRAYYRGMHRTALRRARCVVAVSEFTRRDALAAWPALGGKLVTVRNGVSASFRPVRDPAVLAAVRRSLDLPERYFLYVGTWKRHKNLPRLFAAYGRLEPALRRRFPLVVVAPRDPRYPEVEQHAREAGVHDELLWRSAVPDAELPALYSMARAIVLPSLLEGFGLPVAEALACGTPALVSRAGALPEVGGPACLSCDPYAVDSIAEGFARLAREDALHATLSARALEHARGFSWDRAAREMLAVYCGALAHEVGSPESVHARAQRCLDSPGTEAPAGER